METGCRCDAERGEMVWMGKDLHDSTKNLTNQESKEEKGSPSNTAFQQWLDTLSMRELKDPDGHARLTGTCGETIELFLKFEGDRVRKAAFRTNGCISSRVCAALAAQLSTGKSPDEIVEITGQSILDQLGDFPKGEEHCAQLAAETLQEAVHSYMIKQRKE